MPLAPGADRTTIGKNIAELMRAGRPRPQAVAIALQHARASGPGRQPTTRPKAPSAAQSAARGLFLAQRRERAAKSPQERQEARADVARYTADVARLRGGADARPPGSAWRRGESSEAYATARSLAPRARMGRGLEGFYDRNPKVALGGFFVGSFAIGHGLNNHLGPLTPWGIRPSSFLGFGAMGLWLLTRRKVDWKRTRHIALAVAAGQGAATALEHAPWPTEGGILSRPKGPKV